MQKLAVIPARYEASRFPGKLMQPLGGQTVIAHTYLATKGAGLFDDVWVTTDSDVIADEIERYKGTVVMSKGAHESGTDRIAEAVQDKDVGVIVNVQGDTPFVKKEALKKLLYLFDDAAVQVASLMELITENEVLNDPNAVKVCVDKYNNSLLFSRSVIPYPRNTTASITYYKHIGIYAFRKAALMQFTQWPVGQLEDAEKLEQLRFLENGIRLKMVLTEPMGIDINTQQDLERAQQLMERQKSTTPDSSPA
ncbi:MAG: 3-deoxy-manno-octulosonate cytidylyltransferase [Bacteroidota bacterium]|nr:3-deoxy-manno-octulosonate cytidylyltransferase [Flavisolibacter sp.]MDQ3842857.1 3-deoxy-manno-octulosonate cytidylyltransferase [Bacteroidota bacterium]MBD0284000.1 3-deoxy-manno-octulosonate cytidylyltransferase [Flavisolibacter sp.]MBD0297898.1 3-deoxy-manno-octulosonate cytidylyltransferase [Flavisolibacter sp.]MBD0366309.1 3-deoxy-manno-octulosonate cytidylyltransferase [Flavisolibacter sp.]